MRKKVDGNTERLDLIGKQVAVIDEAHSRDELDDHDERIKKLESSISKN